MFYKSMMQLYENLFLAKKKMAITFDHFIANLIIWLSSVLHIAYVNRIMQQSIACCCSVSKQFRNDFNIKKKWKFYSKIIKITIILAQNFYKNKEREKKQPTSRQTRKDSNKKEIN